MRLLVGSIALLALLVETCVLRGTLEWCDVYLSTASLDLPGQVATIVIGFTKAAPFVGAALVIAGIAVALRAGTDAQEIAAIVVQLAAGLLLAGAFKLAFERARPGDLPWDLAGDSFPSGHVANSILCVGTTLRLLRRGDGHAWLSRLLLAGGGLAFVPAVAFSRVFLARHWMTDVLGSVLLGVALLALAPTPRAAVTQRLLFAMPLVLLGAWAASAMVGRIRLPSPATLSVSTASGWQANDDYLGPMEIEQPSPSPGHPSDRFTLLTPTYGKQQVEVNDGHSAILKLLARPHFDVAEIASHQLELLVDGAIVGTQPLGTGWRMLAFALPTLAPGTHEFELRPLDRSVRMPRHAARDFTASASPSPLDARPR